MIGKYAPEHEMFKNYGVTPSRLKRGLKPPSYKPGTCVDTPDGRGHVGRVEGEGGWRRLYWDPPLTDSEREILRQWDPTVGAAPPEAEEVLARATPAMELDGLVEVWFQDQSYSFYRPDQLTINEEKV